MTVDRDVIRRLDRLESIEAIRRLVASYAKGADRKNDPSILGPLFAKEASWEAVGFGRFEGRETIARELARMAAEQILWSIHFMVSPLIDLDDDGENASCNWYLWELCTMANDGAAAPADTWLGGWYDSRLKRQGGQWLFSSVHLDLRLIGAAERPWDTKKPVSG